MRYPFIVFHLSKDSLLKREDGFQNLSRGVLETLLLESRQAVTLIETELQLRVQQPVQQKDLDRYYERLQKVSKEISIRQRLEDGAAHSARDLQNALASDLHNPSLARKTKVYYEFLNDVTRQCGCESALLCIIALGKHRLERIKKDDRVSLLEFLGKSKESLVPSELVTFVTAFGFPESTVRLYDLIKFNPVAAHPTDEAGASRKRTWHGVDDYCSFSYTSRTMIENMPEPFRSGIGTSNLWKEALRSNGLNVTNCMSLHIPEMGGEDAYLIVRLGFQYGYLMANVFKFGSLS
ncbi:uncharacterized protein N7518_007059 [Penicillium psychrosexuale]|uniref:uncharacterized protein n=1 Tax=Penicillium psychrosexuale TaxID=1002107 RepID=UPI00254569DB|nr:uncharacterized protein N7518_007059 [Penicillium psychrosexuale]KAJ5790048.1 hypothetical protein N7518_007059 [Penicillium psychrosexuale]